MYDIRYAIIVRVGNMDATLVLRCLSEPESKADLRSVKISELAQKLTEIATFFQNLEPFEFEKILEEMSEWTRLFQ